MAFSSKSRSWTCRATMPLLSGPHAGRGATNSYGACTAQKERKHDLKATNISQTSIFKRYRTGHCSYINSFMIFKYYALWMMLSSRVLEYLDQWEWLLRCHLWLVNRFWQTGKNPQKIISCYTNYNNGPYCPVICSVPNAEVSNVGAYKIEKSIPDIPLMDPALLRSIGRGGVGQRTPPIDPSYF